MASCSPFTFISLCCFLLFLSSSFAKTTSRPKALILQVTKDVKTLQYVTQVSQRTPLVPVKLTLDLGGPFMWVNCERGYTSSTYKPAPCGSAPCRLLNTTSCTVATTCDPPVPDCFNNTCGSGPDNPIANTGTSGQLGADVFTIQSTDGKNVLRVVTVPRLYFICGNNFVNDGLASGVTGIAGLGRTGASLPAQLSSYFRFNRVFALCLSSSTRSNGAVFFGNGPYTLLPNVDASSGLTYTPLIVNPATENGFLGDASPKYFIEVKSIKINDKRVKLNDTLLAVDSEGNPGTTTISTANPYTVLESSIYTAFVSAFVKAMPKNVERVPNVAPFGACFSSKNIGSTRLGPAVPTIDLVLQSKNVWSIFGANSMVEVSKDVLCLGFVEARTDITPRFSVVIGGHQIEDNLLQFDLSASRLGFSSSLLGRSTTCANFNFTSTS
ncbi:aspartic peptidase [Tanacetum coccineum]